MIERRRWKATGVCARGDFVGSAALVWAAANEPAGSSPARTNPESIEIRVHSEVRKVVQASLWLYRGREAAAMTFVRMNHPELATLLDQLKLNDLPEYQRAIRELFHSSEKLAQLQERNPKRYPWNWKLGS